MRSIRLEKHLALGNYSFCPIISPVQFTNAKLKLNIDIVSMDPPVQTTQKFLTFALFAFIWCIPFKCNEGFYFLDAISKITPQTESLRMYAARTEIIGIQGTYNSIFPHGDIGKGIKGKGIVKLIALITAYPGLEVKT